MQSDRPRGKGSKNRLNIKAKIHSQNATLTSKLNLVAHLLRVMFKDLPSDCRSEAATSHLHQREAIKFGLENFSLTIMHL